MRVITHADDAALLIGSNSHQKLEENAGDCAGLITNCRSRQERQFNAKKQLPRGVRPESCRNPTIKLHGQVVRLTTCVK